MGYAYMIGPPNPSSGLRMNADELAYRIKGRWRDAKVRLQEERTSFLQWSVPLGETRLLGGLLPNQEVIYLEGALEQVAEFAAWYRGIVPMQYELVFFYEGRYEQQIPLVQGITAEGIVSAFTDNS